MSPSNHRQSNILQRRYSVYHGIDQTTSYLSICIATSKTAATDVVFVTSTIMFYEYTATTFIHKQAQLCVHSISWTNASVIFVTKIKTRTRIIGRRFQRTRTRIILIQKTKTK